MVESATSLGRNGVQDWLIQRITAVILAFYVAFLLGYLLLHPQLTYEAWISLFTYRYMQYGTLLALFSLVLHAWIGMWTVITDYIKPTLLRVVIQIIVMCSLLLCLVWGIQIVWRIECQL